MDGSAVVSSKDNIAVRPPVANGTAKYETETKTVVLNDSSSSTSSNDATGNSSKAQQQKQTNGTACIVEGIVEGGQRKTPTSTELMNNARNKKAAAGVELKGKIIEFMRDKPFLWNRWHPGYNDNKRRENEFTLFSHEIDYPVSEIKRVWHVLRTNFFRAHKYQVERGLSVDASKSERCWKYYQSMRFILESAQNNSNDEVSINNDSLSINDDSSSSIKDIRQTRSIKALKVSRGDRRTTQRINQQPINHSTSDSSNNSTNVPSALIIATTGPANTSATTPSSGHAVSASDNAKITRGNRTDHRKNLDTLRDDNLDTSIITNISANQFSLAHGRASALSAFNEMSRISFDADDDHLYARSLMATLKKFDPTTKEVIKLKFQEIIVEYMQKQQQQQQQLLPAPVQPTTTTATTTTNVTPATQPKQS